MCFLVSNAKKKNRVVNHKFSLSTFIERREAANVRTSIAASIDGISGSSPSTFASPNGAVKDFFSLNGCHSLKSINVKPKSPTPMLESAKLEHKAHTFQFFESMFTFINFILTFKRPKWLCRNIINVPSICGLTKLDQSRYQNMAPKVAPWKWCHSCPLSPPNKLWMWKLLTSIWSCQMQRFIHQAGKPSSLSRLPCGNSRHIYPCGSNAMYSKISSKYDSVHT